MLADPRSPATKPPPIGKRFGYVLAALLNAALVYLVHNLLARDVAPFLTADFDRVVPIVTVSLARVVMIIAIVGAGIGIITECVKLAKAVAGD